MSQQLQQHQQAKTEEEDKEQDLSNMIQIQQHGLWYQSTWQSLWPTNATGSKQVLDDTLVVAACQKLLQQGRKTTPTWLQTSVSTTLQTVAEQNLMAVWVVFGTGLAPLRLARTLVTGPFQRYHQQHNNTITSTNNRNKSTVLEKDNTNNDDSHNKKNLEVFQPLVTQLCVVIDQILQTQCPSGSGLTTVTSWTEADQKKMEFVWALLEQFPQLVQETIFFVEMARGDLTRNANQTNTLCNIHVCVRRWTILFHWVPPFVNVIRWSRILWQMPLGISDNSIPSIPVFVMLWELATARITAQSTVQTDAMYAVQLWSQAVLAANWKDTNALDVFSLWILHLLQPKNPNYEYIFTGQDNGLDHVTVRSVSSSSTALFNPAHHVQVQAQILEHRAKIVIEKLVLPLSQESVAKANTGLPSRLLQILVVLYLSFGSDRSENEIVVPKKMLTSDFQLVCLTLLPVLCEHCSLESLLANPASSVPLLNLISLVLRTVSLQLHGAYDSAGSYSKESNIVKDLTVATDIVSKILPNQHDDSEDTFSNILSDEESKLSIASVLLTLLVGVLELGAERRTNDEEMAFHSLIPSLTDLSSISDTSNLNDSMIKELSEMAEMASHANVLIATRSVKPLERKELDDALDPIARQYLEAKDDLESTEVPMRARGVVTLRHLTFALTNPQKSVLKMEHSVTLSDIVSLAIQALADKESYVYLAAIQTIAAAALQDSTDMLPRLCSAFASGYFKSKDVGEIALSSEQRVKLVEALAAFVRRKASLVQHLDDILSTLFNSVTTPTASPSVEKANLIQVETHHYFVGNKESDDTIDKEAQWEEVKVRVNTGGPVFDIEENDLVRGAAISLVAEVVRVSSPASLARFAPTLIQCAKMSLQLDSSRPVRRSGALLASSLYGAILREIEEQDPQILSKQQLECPLTLAMVSNDEASLVTFLARTEKGEDLMDLKEDRYFDPATVARCREALTTRQSIEETGVIGLAALSISSQGAIPGILKIQKEYSVASSPKSLISIVDDT
jgi:hypothetical protein